MKRTMYNIPVLHYFLSPLCRFALWLLGWNLQSKPPEVPKYVLIGVPHTSNWDFPLALSMAFVYKIDMHWMGKDSLFKGWQGPLMRWMGGIPIIRSSSHNVVAQIIDSFNQNDQLVVAIPPEGTRSRVEKWKTGFYYIALGAKVPIALAFLDYKKKTGGFLSLFHPSGDAEKDIATIRASYKDITPKHPDQFNRE